MRVLVTYLEHRFTMQGAPITEPETVILNAGNVDDLKRICTEGFFHPEFGVGLYIAPGAVLSVKMIPSKRDGKNKGKG